MYVCEAYYFDGSAFFVFGSATRETGVSAKGEREISASEMTSGAVFWRKMVEMGLMKKVD